MFRITSLFLCVMLAWALGSTYGEGVDLEKEKQELLRMHASDRRAHFETNVDMLETNTAEDFITVSRGEIHNTNPADRRKMFSEYFKGAKYAEWDDLQPPIVEISKDGTMAWMIVRTKVRRTQKDANQRDQEQAFTYAGIMCYEKRNGKWIRVANVSTFAETPKP